MDVPGFTLLLQDFCAYCADFEVEVESFDMWNFPEHRNRFMIFDASTGNAVRQLLRI